MITGKDLINFIQENQLEDTPVFPSPHDSSVQFGNWKVKENPTGGLTYLLMPEGNRKSGYVTEVEIMQYKDGNEEPDLEIITPEQALAVREAVLT